MGGNEREEVARGLDHVAAALREVHALSEVGDPAYDASMLGQIAAVERGASLLRRLSRTPDNSGDDMVERVARAIAPNVLFHFDGDTVERARKWDEYYPSEKDKAVLRLIANDAIAAISNSGDDMVEIPRGVYDFLMGTAPLDGVWFGEVHGRPGGPRGRFWWRNALALSAPAEDRP